MKKLALIILSAGLLATAVFSFPSPSLATTKCFTYDPGGTLTTSLVSYYPMEGNSNDFYGSNNGVDTSVTYGTSYGKVNEGVNLAASADTITLPTLMTQVDNWSISAWVRPSSLNNIGMAVNIGDTGSANGYGFGIGTSSGGKGSSLVALYGGVTWIGTSYNYTNTTTWVYVTLVRSSGTLTVYVNGSSVGTSTATPNTPTGSQIGLGSPWVSTWGASAGFQGAVDEVGIWSKALSATEITDLYNGGAGQTMTTCGGGAKPMSWTTIMFF